MRNVRLDAAGTQFRKSLPLSFGSDPARRSGRLLKSRGLKPVPTSRIGRVTGSGRGLPSRRSSSTSSRTSSVSWRYASSSSPRGRHRPTGRGPGSSLRKRRPRHSIGRTSSSGLRFSSAHLADGVADLLFLIRVCVVAILPTQNYRARRIGHAGTCGASLCHPALSRSLQILGLAINWRIFRGMTLLWSLYSTTAGSPSTARTNSHFQPEPRQRALRQCLSHPSHFHHSVNHGSGSARKTVCWPRHGTAPRARARRGAAGSAAAAAPASNGLRPAPGINPRHPHTACRPRSDARCAPGESVSGASSPSAAAPAAE